jgi:hypothetical protein
MRRRKQLQIRVTPEFARSRARRDACYVGQCGWRPSKQDLANLRASAADAIAYSIMLRAWRLAGFPVAAIGKLARRKPKLRERNSPPPPAQTSFLAAPQLKPQPMENTTMRVDDVFSSRFLKSADAKAEPIIATIHHVALEVIGTGQDQKKKPVLHFEDSKPAIINRTNWDVLEAALGDSDNWAGHKVQIRCAPTRFQGKTVDGIRIDPIVSTPAQAPNELPPF